MRYFIVMVLLVATAIWAYPQGRGGGPMMPGHGGGIVKMLKLTDDQQKQFEKLQSDLQKKQIDLRSKLETMRVDLRDLFRADNPDQAKIESQMTEISKVQNEMKLTMVGHWFSINKMLTPEQQKIWKEHRQIMNGPDGMRGRMGPVMNRLRGIWDRIWHHGGTMEKKGQEKEGEEKEDRP